MIREWESRDMTSEEDWVVCEERREQQYSTFEVVEEKERRDQTLEQKSDD